MQVQEEGRPILPIDIVTGCYDLVQCVTGMKEIPVDKTQRLSILSLREDRLPGRVRRFYHWPTEVTAMDSLTKQGIFPQMQDYLISGAIRYARLLKKKNDIENVITAKEITVKSEFTEHDLVNTKA
eukprot:8823563-Pyramimonas_sp.AAC.1